MTSPIDRPDFNIYTKREPDPEMMAQGRALARTWRAHVEATNDARADVDGWIIDAKRTGHSYAQIREVTGMAIGTIQLILAKAGEL